MTLGGCGDSSTSTRAAKAMSPRPAAASSQRRLARCCSITASIRIASVRCVMSLCIEGDIPVIASVCRAAPSVGSTAPMKRYPLRGRVSIKQGLSGLSPSASRNLLMALLSPCSKRSEEHTSELQSRLHLVCRLLLEKKKNASSSLRPPRLLSTQPYFLSIWGNRPHRDYSLEGADQPSYVNTAEPASRCLRPIRRHRA